VEKMQRINSLQSVFAHIAPKALTSGIYGYGFHSIEKVVKLSPLI